MLVIPRSFRRDVERGRPRVQLLLDGTDPLTAARVGGIVAQVAARVRGPRASPASPGARGPVRSRGRIDVRQRFWFNPTLRDRNFFLSALAGMLLTNLCLSASSLGLVGERESGTYEQMLALPTTPLEIVLGKLLPYVGVSYVVLVLATVGTGLVFGIWPAGKLVTLVVVTLPFVLASLAIGVFVSALAQGLGAGGVHLGVLHPAVVRALGRHDALPADAAGGPRDRRAPAAALVPDRVAPGHRTRRRARRRRRSDAGRWSRCSS